MVDVVNSDVATEVIVVSLDVVADVSDSDVLVGAVVVVNVVVAAIGEEVGSDVVIAVVVVVVVNSNGI